MERVTEGMDASEKNPMDKELQMVVFDVEGVILPKQRYLLEEIRLLSSPDRLRVILDGLMYELGLRPLKQSLGGIYRRFRGVAFEDFAESFNRVPLLPGISEVFAKLREKGLRTAMISSGVPEPFVQKIADRLGADYAVGPKLEV